MINSASKLFTTFYSFFGLLLVVLVANIFQSLFTPLYFVSVPLYRFLDGLVYRCGIRVMAYISYIACGGIEYIITGDEPDDKEMQKNQLFLLNHISSADCLKFGRENCIRYFLKSGHKSVPLGGWVCWFHEMIFLDRDYEKDKYVIRKQLESFIEHNTPCWLVLYPEGTFVTPECKDIVLKSQKYARENNLRVCKNVLTPRVKAFELCMDAKSRKLFDYVTDLTLAFPNHDVELGKTDPPLMMDLFQRREQKLKVHVHIRRFKTSEIPEDSGKWLQKIFEEKEDILEYFKKNGYFPGKQYEKKDNMVDLTLSFFAATALSLACAWWLWHHCPILLGFILLFIFSCEAFIMYYDYKHQTKDVVKKSKRE